MLAAARAMLGRLLVVSAFAIVGGSALAVYVMLHDRPAAGGLNEAAVVEVEIPRDASTATIVAALRRGGVAPYPRLTSLALGLGGPDDGVKAGTYAIPVNANAIEVVRVLRGEPARTRITLTLVPGRNVWQHAARIEGLSLGTRQELLTLAADRARIVRELGLPVGPPRVPRDDGVAQTYLEGFLFPETYFLEPTATTMDAVRIATRQFKKEWKTLSERYESDLMALRVRFPKLDAFQLVTLASLVEEEAVVPAEAAAIAGVFYNRLARKMRLQTDPTLIYRPDRVGRAPRPSDRRDRTNPYNTYAHGGLPPGPICSPGRNALLAAIRPERHDYLYFVARRDGRGTHAFARTLAEHKANIARFLKGKGD